MTKKCMSEKVREWNISIGKLESEKEELREALKDLNEKYGDGCRWCNDDMNYRGIVLNSDPKNVFDSNVSKAGDLLRRINNIAGQYDALCSFLRITDNFNL